MTQCQKSGRELPEAMQDAPSVDPGLTLYYKAFWELHTCRPVGMSVGAIPWMAMADYARALGFDAEQTDLLFHHVRRMDDAYLKKVASDMKASEKARKAK